MDFKTQIKSTVATGTAPLSIASTTAVTNLNADLLDGNHASAFALSSHNHTSLTGITSLVFASEASDVASLTTTINGSGTYFDFNLTDDNNNDWWRWRFTPSGSTVYDSMTLKPMSNGVSDLTVSGKITGTQLVSTVTTGTSPLTISSATMVTNLNADLLDGNHASAFYLATNPNGYTTNTGTVTSVAAGAGMNFTTFTTTGSVVMGTPSTLTAATSNSASGTTHSHAVTTTASGAASTIVATDASGNITATDTYNFGTAADVKYNSTTKSIDFIFA